MKPIIIDIQRNFTITPQYDLTVTPQQGSLNFNTTPTTYTKNKYI